MRVNVNYNRQIIFVSNSSFSFFRRLVKKLPASIRVQCAWPCHRDLFHFHAALLLRRLLTSTHGKIPWSGALQLSCFSSNKIHIVFTYYFTTKNMTLKLSSFLISESCKHKMSVLIKSNFWEEMSKNIKIYTPCSASLSLKPMLYQATSQSLRPCTSVWSVPSSSAP